MEKINGNRDSTFKSPRKPRILVAPLDWGLGHAARCIPVIHELLQNDAEVWLAAEDRQEALLKEEFPGLSFVHLPGYRIKYGRTSMGLLRNILFQAPRILKAIKNENRWLKKMVDEYHFDAVISDNRFGLYHSFIPAVFITHQLMIKTPFGKWADGILQRRNYRYINRFSECWVPDNKEDNIFAGELSHPEKMPSIPVRYTGLLSRLKKRNAGEKKGHLFISLSGPEPQRTLLENKIIKDISHYNGTATVVRGLPGSANIIPSTNDIKFYNHLPTNEFSREMGQAEYVISRGGYSTIMDIIALGKKSILIPTPGQTEQEYLANYLSEKRMVLTILQEEFSLNNELQKAGKFNYGIVNDFGRSALTVIINSFISQLRGKNQTVAFG
jgi:uncharacterized protein (TIGR00661 family)